ncbi:hypothetical protein RND81_09G227600 [Saponaria officinalis]|uniref:F-box associated beta-propeller type 1 domain-containing protein n=1 Tax=Saponaria officinalis TaxID=3572 RepID=A0AAW1IR58_SAPOF
MNLNTIVWFALILMLPNQLIGRDVVIKIDQFDTKCCQIVGSCNGLICLWSPVSGLALYNPSTREYCRLSDPPPMKAKTISSCYGFGRDCISHHYKIFKISSILSDNAEYNSMAQVYNTSTTNSWRNVGEFPMFVFVHKNGVVVNNKLHWSYINPHGDNIGSERIKILTCDLHTEEFAFESLQYPNTQVKGFVSYLTVSDGLLYLIVGKCSVSHVSIWVMKEYGVSDSWIKVADFVGSSLYKAVTCKSTSEGEEVLLIKCGLINGSSLKFEWYNFRDKSTKNVEISTNSRRALVSHLAWECTRSLTPIPGNDHKYSWERPF